MENLPKEEIPELLNSIGISIKHTSVFSGPIPPPDQLIEYNEIDSTFADRIVAMAEKEQDNRHTNDNNEFTLDKRSQTFAFVIAIFGIGMSGLLAIQGNPISATGFGLGSIVLMVTAFLKGKKSDDTQENSDS